MEEEMNGHHLSRSSHLRTFLVCLLRNDTHHPPIQNYPHLKIFGGAGTGWNLPIFWTLLAWWCHTEGLLNGGSQSHNYCPGAWGSVIAISHNVILILPCSLQRPGLCWLHPFLPLQRIQACKASNTSFFRFSLLSSPWTMGCSLLQCCTPHSSTCGGASGEGTGNMKSPGPSA